MNTSFQIFGGALLAVVLSAAAGCSCASLPGQGPLRKGATFEITFDSETDLGLSGGRAGILNVLNSSSSIRQGFPFGRGYLEVIGKAGGQSPRPGVDVAGVNIAFGPGKLLTEANGPHGWVVVDQDDEAYLYGAMDFFFRLNEALLQNGEFQPFNHFYYPAGGIIRLALFNGTGGGTGEPNLLSARIQSPKLGKILVTSKKRIEPDCWYHVALTFEPVSRNHHRYTEMKIYLREGTGPIKRGIHQEEGSVLFRVSDEPKLKPGAELKGHFEFGVIKPTVFREDPQHYDSLRFYRHIPAKFPGR